LKDSNSHQFTRPTLLQSIIPLIAIVFFLGIGYGLLHLKAEILLIAAASVAAVIALRLGYTYKDLEKGIIASMMKGMPAMLIVIVVGALIGSWIADFMRGGTEIGQNTLTRFYLFHVVLLPFLIIIAVAGHLYLIRSHGVSELKFIGDEKEIDVLCPLCATGHKGTVEKE
jgi:quinol-cytochrome oxidoreductase complex cytochrome b subunit